MRNVRYIGWLYALLALGYAGAPVPELHVHLAFAFLTAAFVFTLKRQELGLSPQALSFLVLSLSGAIAIAYAATGAVAWILMGLYCAAALAFLAGPAARPVGDGLLLLAATAIFTVSAGLVRSPYLLATIPPVILAASGVFVALAFPQRRAPLWKIVVTQTAAAAALSVLLFLMHPLPVHGLRAIFAWLGRTTGIAREGAPARGGGSLWSVWPVKIQDTSPAKADNTPILRVKIESGQEMLLNWPDKPVVHLRGAVYTDYGHGWWTTIWLYMGIFDTQHPGRVELMTPKAGARFVDATVTALREPARILFTLAEPYAFLLSEIEEANGTFRVRAELPALQEYAFRSIVVDRGDPRFMTAPPAAGEPITTFVPPELQPLADKGREITSGLTAALDIARRITRELDQTCNYALYPAGPPGRQDPIVWFFENEKLGNCRHFATAALAMLRGAGVPCRLVTGFASTDRDAATQTFTVRMHDLHAWIEIEVEDFGWVTVDPTPALAYNNTGTIAVIRKDGKPTDNSFDTETGLIVTTDSDAKAKAPSWLERLSAYSSLVIPEIPWIVTGLAALALLAILAAPAVQRVVRKVRPSQARPEKSPVAFLNEFLNLLRSAGHSPAPAETMPRFAARLPASYPRDAVAAVVRLYHIVRFGGGALSDEERGAVRSALSSLRAVVRRG